MEIRALNDHVQAWVDWGMPMLPGRFWRWTLPTPQPEIVHVQKDAVNYDLVRVILPTQTPDEKRPDNGPPEPLVRHRHD